MAGYLPSQPSPPTPHPTPHPPLSPVQCLCLSAGPRPSWVTHFNRAPAPSLLAPCLQDPTPVQDKGPPKSVTVEGSFLNALYSLCLSLFFGVW